MNNNYGKGIMGGLLPEQASFFTHERDVADVIDWQEEYNPPYYIYVEGQLIRKVTEKEHGAGHYTDIYQLGEELSKDESLRVVILDNNGDIVFTSAGEVLLMPGSFHLVYTMQNSAVWGFFIDGAGQKCLIADAYDLDHGNFVTLDPVTTANADFNEEDLRPYSESVQVHVLALQKIARLYPLLEIKVYP